MGDTIDLGPCKVYANGELLFEATSATVTRPDPSPTDRAWSWPQRHTVRGSFPVSFPNLLVALGPSAFPLYFPPAPTYRPTFAGALPPVDVTASLAAYLDHLEREYLGSTWKSSLDVTRGEWFAMAITKRGRVSNRLDSLLEGMAFRAEYDYTPGAANPIANIQAWLQGLRDPEVMARQNELLSGWIRSQLDAVAAKVPPRHRPYPEARR